MPLRRCDGCHRNRTRFVQDGQRLVCRVERICDMADGRTLELAFTEHGPLSLHGIRQLGEQITAGHASARQTAEYFGGAVPRDVDQFLDVAVRLHQLIFAGTGLSYGGRIRHSEDEAVVVDRGRHELAGAAPAEIRPLLEKTLSHAMAALLSDEPGRLARGSAILLEGLFRAHPFLDGNGRVGRLLVRIYVQRSGRYQLLEFANHGKAGRAYIGALRYARRKMRDDATTQRSDPHRHLTDWLSRHIVEVSTDL